MTRTKLALLATSLTLALGALMGASCGDKPQTSPDDFAGLGKALDRQDGVVATEPAAATKPISADAWKVQGVDASALSDRGKARFAGLLDKLPSPCDKPHSLRTSLDDDTTCKRAPFAGRYVVELVSEDEDDVLIRELYERRYRDKRAREFDLAAAPHVGPRDAKVTIVEFFDYGCPHCAAARSIIEQVASVYPRDVAIYYKQFPLASNPTSVPAAVASLAAHRQGKFEAMHELLFANQRAHSKTALVSYAAEIGLDVAAFEAALAEPGLEKRVLDDRQEGIDAGIQGTPTIFINGREYSDQLGFEFLRSWVEEELAVNR